MELSWIMLRCSTTKGYPLAIKPVSLIYEESPFDGDMIRRLLPKVDYPALRQACEQLEPLGSQQGIPIPKLPLELPSAEGGIAASDDLQRELHRALFDIHVQEGALVCPDTGREFTIKEGIPNMILHEDEL